MATRAIHLIAFRNASKQRAHFAIYVPSKANPNRGTLIHVVGLPMKGYSLEFKRNYSPLETKEKYEMWEIGHVHDDKVVDCTVTDRSKNTHARDVLEQEATKIPAPGKSENFRAPVNDTTNRRCQEWTTDYVRDLVNKGIIPKTALDIVQSKRDPPKHGIM